MVTDKMMQKHFMEKNARLNTNWWSFKKKSGSDMLLFPVGE